MKSFQEIIATFKVELKTDKKKKVFDKDIASLLNIEPSRFATLKKRDSTPFVEILEYCHKEKICADKIFFD